MEEISAYHEAGHALLAVLMGAQVESVTIAPDWDDGPERYADIRVKWPLDQFTERELLEKSILVALAGPVAEMLHSGETFHPGLVTEWRADWQLAWQTAAALIPAEQKRMVYLEQKTASLFQLLDQETHWAALAAIVDLLLAHDTLDGDEVTDAIAPWLS